MPIADSCCGRGSLALLPSWIRRPATQLRDRGLLRNISAKHGRLWKRLIVMLIQHLCYLKVFRFQKGYITPQINAPAEINGEENLARCLESFEYANFLGEYG
jgi:hypothetical protein